MRDGILVLDKPKEWTSSDCVAVCRRAFGLKGVKKIGHGGTLDPMAEGLLPIFIGQATRIMEYMDLDYKTYLCRAKLGLTTDTQDIWGETIGEGSTEGITHDDIERELGSFIGVIEQIPPQYSAVRIDGKRLYEYARQGKTPDREVRSRKVHIEKLDIVDMDLKAKTVAFEIRCSKGTYIRTICEELGRKLGCGAVMEYLKRTAVGQLDLSKAMSPEEIKSLDDDRIEEIIDPIMLPADSVLEKFGKIVLSKERADYFRRGNSTVWRNVRVIKRPDVSINVCSGEIPVNARGRSYDTVYRVYEDRQALHQCC